MYENVNLFVQVDSFRVARPSDISISSDGVVCGCWRRRGALFPSEKAQRFPRNQGPRFGFTLLAFHFALTPLKLPLTQGSEMRYFSTNSQQ